MPKYQGMPNGADPMEYPPQERTDYAVSYATGQTCRINGCNADELGAVWDKNEGSFLCCGCGCSLRFWGSTS